MTPARTSGNWCPKGAWALQRLETILTCESSHVWNASKDYHLASKYPSIYPTFLETKIITCKWKAKFWQNNEAKPKGGCFEFEETMSNSLEDRYCSKQYPHESVEMHGRWTEASPRFSSVSFMMPSLSGKFRIVVLRSALDAKVLKRWRFASPRNITSVYLPWMQS